MPNIPQIYDSFMNIFLVSRNGTLFPYPSGSASQRLNGFIRRYRRVCVWAYATTDQGYGAACSLAGVDK